MFTVLIDHVKEDLPDFVLGKLNTKAQAAISAHLARCVACRKEEELVRAAFDGMPVNATGRSLSPGYAASLLPRIRQRLEAGRSRRIFEQFFEHRFVLPAATVLVGMLLFANAFRTGENVQGANVSREWIASIDPQEFESDGVPGLADTELNEEIVLDGFTLKASLRAVLSSGEAIELYDTPTTLQTNLLRDIDEQTAASVLSRLAERNSL